MKSLTKQEKTGKKAAKVPHDLEEKQTPAGIDPHALESMENEKESDYKIYNNNIYVLVDDLIEREYAGKSQEELKQNRSFFPVLVNYIYKNYLCNVFRNSLEYKLKGVKPVYNDIQMIDNIFNIYIDLVYKYKFNNRPSILEFSLITGISRDTIYNWLNGNIDNYINNSPDDDKRKYITSEYIDTARKWQAVCEQSLVDGNGEYVKEIFLLKAKHGYKDNNNDIQITVNHKAIIDADNLPDLIGISSKN